jgi:hypothetical protein
VLEKLKSDIYAKSEVWDFSKVSLYKAEEWMECDEDWRWLLGGRSRFIRLSVRLEIHDREDWMGKEGWNRWARMGVKIGCQNWVDWYGEGR